LLKAGFDLSNIGNGFQRPSGLQRAEGIEADFVYTPASFYQVLASATWTFKRSIVEPDPTTINKVRGGTYDSGIPGDTRDQNHLELAACPSGNSRCSTSTPSAMAGSKDSVWAGE
jgi:hypothetical protein